MTDPNMGSESFLVALQLADSSLPIGRYVHSSGLEGMLDELPNDSAQIVEVIESVILHGSGRCDAIASAHAYRSFFASDLGRLHFVDSCLLATKMTMPARSASISCGRQLAKLAAQVWPHEALKSFCNGILDNEGAGNLAVVSAAVSASIGVGIEHTVLAELRGVAGGLLSAAVRLGRMKPTEAQVYLHKLIPIIVQVKEVALSSDLEDMSSTTFELDISMLESQRNPLRLFAT